MYYPIGGSPGVSFTLITAEASAAGTAKAATDQRRSLSNFYPGDLKTQR
jgi:hypothetical protein